MSTAKAVWNSLTCSIGEGWLCEFSWAFKILFKRHLEEGFVEGCQTL